MHDIWLIFMVNVGKYPLHGSYRYSIFNSSTVFLSNQSFSRCQFTSFSFIPFEVKVSHHKRMNSSSHVPLSKVAI